MTTFCIAFYESFCCQHIQKSFLTDLYLHQIISNTILKRLGHKIDFEFFSKNKKDLGQKKDHDSFMLIFRGSFKFYI